MQRTEITVEQRERIRIMQLEMMKEVERICNKYGIIYCLGYGTMLGAIRHKGFIPWDDDADILMLREDYNKFKEVCRTELPSKFFFQDSDTDSEYLWGYAKLRNINTEYVRCGQEHIKCRNGVFIDIFPLDNVPNSLLQQIYQDIECMILRKILWAKVGQYDEENMVKRCVYKIMAKVSKEKVYYYLNKRIDLQRNKNAKRVRCLLFIAPGKHWNKRKNPLKIRYGFDKDWILSRERVVFEETEFWGSKEYDQCLRYLYGDYMQLPPEEKRVGHAPVSKINLRNEGLKNG